MMKSEVALVRTLAAVCTSLALTACVGPLAEEEAASSDEATSVIEREIVGDSCTNWSGWYWDGSSTTCDVRLSCGTYCDEFGNCNVNPATYKQEYSYRVCFDQYGNYSHTEYQYRRGAYQRCGC